jgi:hypothetical protein
MAQVELDVSIRTTQARALEFMRNLARDDDFRARAAREPVRLLEEYGFTLVGADRIHFSPLVPPKHVVEEALVNVAEASEFTTLDEFESEDPFAFWLFAVMIAV